MATCAAVDVSCLGLNYSECGREAPDEELVRRSLCGDEDAFGQLYERYRRPVQATVVRILRDREEARDIVQEIFVKVFCSLSQWDPGRAKFSTWLYRLSTNHAIDRWRLRCRRREMQMEKADKDPGRSHAREAAVCLPERPVERRERAEAILRGIQALPCLQRKIVMLRYFEGLRLREIAASEGRTLATVKTSLYRATHLLRARLREWKAMPAVRTDSRMF